MSGGAFKGCWLGSVNRYRNQNNGEVKEMMTIWDTLKYFRKEEFKHPDKMQPIILKMLDDLRGQVGRPLIVTSDFRDTNPTSQHAAGLAVDIISQHIDSFDLFLMADKLPFHGLGWYPHWKDAKGMQVGGVHLDMRRLSPNQPAARWMAIRNDQTGRQEFIALTAANIRKYL